MKRTPCAAAILSVLPGCAANSTCPAGGEAWPSRHVTAASNQGTTVAPRAPADDAVANLAPLAGPGSWLFGSDPLDDGPANETGKSYLIPAAEIIGFEILLNQYDRNLGDQQKDYDTDWSTIKDNLHSGWVIDRDPFAVNQLDHPYAGTIYHGFARSAGLSYWESLLYTFGGSALWEIAGEVERPSLNDQITTSFGGSFLGEALHRTASWLLKGGGERPGWARELGAAAISPPLGFNRLMFGDRFRSLSPSNDPAVFTLAGLGAKTNTHVSGEGASNTEEQTDLLVDFAIDYGLPGKSDYRYESPFDYFHLEVAGLSDSDNHVDRAIVRGLLLGKEYGSEPYRGVWGLYGSYDYISPGIFRVASTALSVGTTAQVRLAQRVALQGSGLAGIGFGAGGTIADDRTDRDYHYGAIPQGTLDLRFVLGEEVMFGLTGRDYFIFGSGVDQNGQSENISQSEISLTVRVYGPHALTVQYVNSFRNANYSRVPDQEQLVESISVTYSFLGATRFGVVGRGTP